jgi:hypothetical protein
MKARYLTSLLAVEVASSLLGAEFVDVPSPNINITAVLGQQLSSNAAIVLPGQPYWANASARWQGYAIPTYQAVVEVSTEKDIQQTVSSIVAEQD